MLHFSPDYRTVQATAAAAPSEAAVAAAEAAC